MAKEVHPYRRTIQRCHGHHYYNTRKMCEKEALLICFGGSLRGSEAIIYFSQKYIFIVSTKTCLSVTGNIFCPDLIQICTWIQKRGACRSGREPNISVLLPTRRSKATKHLHAQPRAQRPEKARTDIYHLRALAPALHLAHPHSSPCSTETPSVFLLGQAAVSVSNYNRKRAVSDRGYACALRTSHTNNRSHWILHSLSKVTHTVLN